MGNLKAVLVKIDFALYLQLLSCGLDELLKNFGTSFDSVFSFGLVILLAYLRIILESAYCCPLHFPSYIRVPAVVWECGKGQTHDQYTFCINYDLREM